MKTKKGTRKLEFKKETIARLGEGQLGGIYGGNEGENGGGQGSVAIVNQCTVVGKTKGANHTCNVVVCKTATAG